MSREPVMVTLPPETVEAIATRAAEIALERLIADQENGSPWLYGAKAASAYLGIPAGQVFKLVAAGTIPCSRVGHRLLFNSRQLDEWVRWKRPDGVPCEVTNACSHASPMGTSDVLVPKRTGTPWKRA